MGEAKRRASQAPKVIYHHTSTLRTNLIWMSGLIALGGESRGAWHPQLGEVQTDVKSRRPCIDFPPLAWFSSSIAIPKCLMSIGFLMKSKNDGTNFGGDAFEGLDPRVVANGLSLNRMALGFPLEGSTITPWRQHFGYATLEGNDLNESARAVGDPDRWYVSEVPVDVLTSCEVWISRSKFKPRLERNAKYLDDIHRMVEMCRTNEGVYIPPSWLTVDQVKLLAGQLNVPVALA